MVSGRAVRGPRRNSADAESGGGTEAQAKEACLRLLTDRARSRAELVERLSGKGFQPEVIQRVLDRLGAVGLIDDADFAQQWVRSRHEHSGKGRAALARELRQKGIAQVDAEAALATVTAEDERERAVELVRRKLRSLRGADFSDRAEREKVLRKLVGMLARRGFAQGMAFDVVRTEMPGAADESDADSFSDNE